MDELNPCPWCGHSAEMEPQGYRNEALVFCPQCSRGVTGECGDIDDAIAAWNALPRVTDLLPILDAARAVCASWEQYRAADALDCDAKDAVAPALETGLDKLTKRVDAYDKRADSARCAGR